MSAPQDPIQRCRAALVCAQRYRDAALAAGPERSALAAPLIGRTVAMVAAMEALLAAPPQETALLQAVYGEYLGRLIGGVPMGGGVFARAYDLDLEAGEFFIEPSVRALRVDGTRPDLRLRLAALDPPSGNALGLAGLLLGRVAAHAAQAGKSERIAYGWLRAEAEAVLALIRSDNRAAADVLAGNLIAASSHFLVRAGEAIEPKQIAPLLLLSDEAARRLST